MIIDAQAALWFLPFCVPVAIWVAWSDMASMKIPNKAVLTMAAIWAVVGLLAFPLPQYGWGWAVLGIVLAVGFILSALGLVGAGDAKFAAAMAPVFSTGDWRAILALFCACLLGAFATHRIAWAIPAIRRATPDWISWNHKDFPMGLALAGTLIFYLLAPFLAN